MAKFIIVSALVLGISFALPLSEQENAINERIVGGLPAGDGHYSHQVSMRDKNKKHFCGGSIISDSWVLTAAQCTAGRKPKDIQVVVGTNYLNSGGTFYTVSKITNHPKYNAQSKINDIALIKTSSKIKFGPKVQFIRLATSALPPSTYCALSGWGSINQSGNFSNVLYHITLRSISITECQRHLPNYPISYTNECTLNGFGQGACHGDSGSPLIVGLVQYGLVSWGIPCARGSPDVYTGIASYRDWIKSVANV